MTKKKNRPIPRNIGKHLPVMQQQAETQPFIFCEFPKRNYLEFEAKYELVEPAHIFLVAKWLMEGNYEVIAFDPDGEEDNKPYIKAQFAAQGSAEGTLKVCGCSQDVLYVTAQTLKCQAEFFLSQAMAQQAMAQQANAQRDNRLGLYTPSR